jgi:hypothetical protein
MPYDRISERYNGAFLDIQIHVPVGLGEVRVDICKVESVYHDPDRLGANRRTNNTIEY